VCAGASAGGGGAAGLATNLFTVFLMLPTPAGNTEIKTDERCVTLLIQTQLDAKQMQSPMTIVGWVAGRLPGRSG